MGRVEALRSLGLSYKSMEDSGVMLPVLDLKLKYLKPLFYDDEVNLTTKVCDLPGTRIYFEYELKNSEGELTTLAETTLVFIDINGKPCMIPENLKSKIKLISVNDEKLKYNPFIRLLNALCFKFRSERRHVATDILTAT